MKLLGRLSFNATNLRSVNMAESRKTKNNIGVKQVHTVFAILINIIRSKIKLQFFVSPFINQQQCSVPFHKNLTQITIHCLMRFEPN